jgi:hypothetical protein
MNWINGSNMNVWRLQNGHGSAAVPSFSEDLEGLRWGEGAHKSQEGRESYIIQSYGLVV